MTEPPKTSASSPPQHPMLPVPDAIRVVLETTAKAILQQQQGENVGCESVATNANPSQLLGRMLAQDVRMCEPGYPPYRASIMDGYAISSTEFSSKASATTNNSTTEKPWTHRVLDRVYAGSSEVASKEQWDSQESNSQLPAAVYITTGAKIPDAFDCVVPIEQIEQESEDKSNIRIAGTASIQSGKFIRAVGCDISAGSVVLPRGFVLNNPISLGLLQQSGQSQVQLVQPVTVGILSTGNELLISPDAWMAQKSHGESGGTLIQTGQIPDVNKPILTSLITTFGNCQPIDLGMAQDDDAEGMADTIQKAVEQCDVILTTGGISMGETDIVEDVLVRRLGGVLHFGRLNMKPGKPTTFITLPTRNNPKRKCLVFALPGNPVSATVCTHLVVRPCLNMLMQYRGGGVPSSTTSHQDDESQLIHQMMQDTQVQPEITAQLTHDIPLDTERPEYHRVVLSTTTSHDNRLEYQATSTGEQRSSRLMSLRDAEGLLVLPQGSKDQPKALAGQRFPLLLLGDHHNSVQLKNSLHLQQRPKGSSKTSSATRVAILQISDGTKSTLTVDDITERVQKAMSGSKSGAAKVVICNYLEGAALDTIGSHIHKLLAGENNGIDILVVSCTGSFSHSLQVSQRLRQEVTKDADAVALQARRGAASQDGTAALFEPVVGFVLPKSRKNEDGCMLIALPQAGLETGLENVRGLLKHALNVARGETHHHHHHHDHEHHHHHGDEESITAQTRLEGKLKGEQQVLVVGRGIYALPILRILGSKSKTANDEEDVQVHLTFGSVGAGRQDMGSNSRFVDEVICLPRPDGDDSNLEAFANAICAFARGKPNLVIIPVVEETMYLSLIADRIRKESPSVRIFTSDPDTLMTLNDKYSFQVAMADVHPGNVARTSLVKNQKDAIKCIQENFYLNKSAPSVVVKPLVGHGSSGAHIVGRTEFEVASSSPEDFQRHFPMDFDKETYVVQEYVEGQELSTFSLLQNGQVVAHLCYRPRYLSALGFSPIRTLVSEDKWKRTLHYVQKVAATYNLTGNFGFDFMERFNGDMVALECNPRVTNGAAFFSPRFSAEVASRMKQAYLGLLDPKGVKTDWSSTIISPYGNPKIPRHTMTLLPTVSCITRCKTNCESMQILELATQAQDDVWWSSDPLPFLAMVIRILPNLLYAVCLSLVTFKSVSLIFRQIVLSEVVEYNRLSDSLAKRESGETVGGLVNDNLHDNQETDTGLKVLVTGATGFLGGRVVQILNQGYEDDSIPLSDVAKSTSIITATGRNVKRGQKLIESLKPTNKKVHFIAADLSDATETSQLVEGHDVVIHCAALCAISAYWDDCISANTTAAENIVHACHLCGVRMLVHVSTPSVCVSIAPGSGDLLDFQETDPLPPDDYQPNRYSVTKKKAESIVIDVSTRYQIPCIILRPRALFGPGDETLFPVLLDRLKRRKLMLIGGRRDSLTDLTYIDNVVHACLCCLDRVPTSTKVYSITNDDPRKFWDIVDKVCDKLGLERVQKSIPWAVAYTAACLLETVAVLQLLAGFSCEPLTSRYGIGIVSKSTTFDISAAKKDLGYTPVISFDDGLQHFLDTLE